MRVVYTNLYVHSEKNLHCELEEDKIDVMCVRPAVVCTSMSRVTTPSTLVPTPKVRDEIHTWH